jgi:tRNA pseudouridine38-40 synthase
MVRNIVGVLLEIGKGNLTANDLKARLLPGCGIAAGPAAPARGLFLISVEYEKESGVTSQKSEEMQKGDHSELLTPDS